MALTIRNERNLFGDSALDDAMGLVFEMARSDAPAQLASFAQRLGPRTVRALYNWTRSHQANGVGVDIQWRRAETLRARLLMQTPEIGKLVAAIEAAGELTSESVTLSILLVGIDAERSTFHARTDNGDGMTGTIGADLSLSNPAHVPGRYTAHLTRQVYRQYSYEEDVVTWALDSLEPVS